MRLTPTELNSPRKYALVTDVELEHFKYMLHEPTEPETPVTELMATIVDEIDFDTFLGLIEADYLYSDVYIIPKKTYDMIKFIEKGETE